MFIEAKKFYSKTPIKCAVSKEGTIKYSGLELIEQSVRFQK